MLEGLLGQACCGGYYSCWVVSVEKKKLNEMSEYVWQTGYFFHGFVVYGTTSQFFLIPIKLTIQYQKWYSS